MDVAVAEPLLDIVEVQVMVEGVPALGRGLRSDAVTADHLFVAGAIAGRLLESAVTAGLPPPEAGATADHHLMLMGMVLMLESR